MVPSLAFILESSFANTTDVFLMSWASSWYLVCGRRIVNRELWWGWPHSQDRFFDDRVARGAILLASFLVPLQRKAVLSLERALGA